jgi:hypothetical protein
MRVKYNVNDDVGYCCCLMRGGKGEGTGRKRETTASALSKRVVKVLLQFYPLVFLYVAVT